MDAFDLELERVYRQDIKTLPNRMRRRTHRTQDAQDIFQEAFLQVLIRREAPVRHLRAYVWKTANNLAINLGVMAKKRKELLIQFLSEYQQHTEITPLRVLESVVLVRLIQDRINSLPKLYQQAFTLIVYQDHDFISASKILGISPRTVRRHFDRAIEICYRAIKEE